MIEKIKQWYKENNKKPEEMTEAELKKEIKQNKNLILMYLAFGTLIALLSLVNFVLLADNEAMFGGITFFAMFIAASSFNGYAILEAKMELKLRSLTK